jgi:hypothetical protein
MIMTRFVGAAAFTPSLTLFASPGSAKGFYWYTLHSCQFCPGGGHRTPAQTAACRKQKAVVGEVLRFCGDRQRRGPLACEPNQVSLRTTVR